MLLPQFLFQKDSKIAINCRWTGTNPINDLHVRSSLAILNWFYFGQKNVMLKVNLYQKKNNEVSIFFLFLVDYSKAFKVIVTIPYAVNAAKENMV